MRIGQGFDTHAFVREAADGNGARPLMLGGVHIPDHPGLAAHSDGDVLLHAIADALLGALALGDLGGHFCDTDAKWSGADSRDLLRRVWKMADGRGWRLQNLDSTIIADTPRLAPHRPAMIANIAADLQSQPERISVKATTCEGLGFIGRREGIAAQACVLLAPAD